MYLSNEVLLNFWVKVQVISNTAKIPCSETTIETLEKGVKYVKS